MPEVFVNLESAAVASAAEHGRLYINSIRKCSSRARRPNENA